MTDRTVSKVYPSRARGVGAYAIANAIVIGVGALVQLESGFLNHWDETGAFLGMCVGGENPSTVAATLGSPTGDTSQTPDPEGYVDESGFTLTGLTLAGSPTQAKVGDLVYSADSDVASLTLTDTTNPPVGWCSRYTSATDQEVTLFTPAEHMAGIASGTWLV